MPTFKDLIPTENGAGSKPEPLALGWRCSQTAGGTGAYSRLHYDLATSPIQVGDPFAIGCRILLPANWSSGTLLRLENFPGNVNGSDLFRIEVDALQSGDWALVRNHHKMNTATVEWSVLADLPRLPIGRPFDLEMRGVLSTTPGTASTVVLVDGREVARTTASNRSAGGENAPVIRARYGIVAGGRIAQSVDVLDAWVSSPVAPTDPEPDPGPAPTPLYVTRADFDAAVAALAESQSAIGRSVVEAHGRLDDLEKNDRALVEACQLTRDQKAGTFKTLATKIIGRRAA